MNKVIVRALDKADTKASNWADVKKKTDFKNNVITRFGRLVFKNKVIIEDLNKTNIKVKNSTSIIKRPDYENKVFVKIQSKKILEFLTNENC